ncbi:hypothetical protein CRE_19523 [Caenorhabditis remanei]|uniref:F-box domain-containing protein n=1 Tax=Caenorhabditis remanei TaxID=31234 RepID=E3NI01_CAERE|nr:hypothetical protein CRE_19523 [Caenorhabditis remanei]
MDSPKPFPILRLPFLAIEEVFKAMHPFEIINFSLITERTKAVTKNMTFRSKYTIRLCVHKQLGIEIYGTNHLVSCTYLMTSYKQKLEKTVEDEHSGYITRRVFNYSNDPVDEWKQLCKYVMEIFKRKSINMLSMTMDEFVDHNVSIIDFLKNYEILVDICMLYQTREENNVDEHVAYLLENVTVNVELLSGLNIKDKNFYGKIPKNLNDLFIYYSEWIGYERLLEIDSKHVTLENDEISDKEWNLFLKKWMAMETNLNLAYLRLSRKELGTFREHVLYDIPYEVVSEDVSRILPCRYKLTQKVNGGIDIRRIDGKTATFFVPRPGWNGSFLMCIH